MLETACPAGVFCIPEMCSAALAGKNRSGLLIVGIERLRNEQPLKADIKTAASAVAKARAAK
jgi:hypothetical protein